MRVPTPGRRVSCATRLSIAGETTGQFCLCRWSWPRSAGALELGEPVACELAHRLGQLRLRFEHLLEFGAAECEAAHGALRDDSGPSQAIVLDERDLADDLAGPELALEPMGLDGHCAVTDHEHPRARRPRLDQHLIDRTIVCVVEQPVDLISVERTHEYRGLYHVLGGALSPLDGVEPEHLRIDELLGRVERNGIEEVVLATNPNMTGEATAAFLADRLRGRVRVTRLASGLPVGGDLEYADEVTLGRALAGRREM